MRKKLVKAIAVIGLSYFSVTASPVTAEVVNLDEARVREIVKEVIKENPKLIFDSVNDYIKLQREEKEAEQFESSFKNRIRDIAVSEKNPVKGNKDAQIAIIEYSDFQCPYCSKAIETIEQVLKEYPEKVKLIFKHNPLEFHKQALPAAKASLAAYKQGKFWEYHDLLFKNSSNMNEEMLIQFAKDLKLDLEKFNTDRKSPEIEEQIKAEQAEAEKHGLKGTPSFLVDGVLVRGARDKEHFVMVIERILAEKDKEAQKK